MLCPFLRPHFVAPAVYEQVRAVCRGIFRAIEKVEAGWARSCGTRVDLTPAERELVAIDPGYRRSSPTSRLDSFVTTSAYQFVELNAESPAGIAYAEVLMDIFLELPHREAVPGALDLTRFQARERLLQTLLDCYREGGGREEHPVIAIVDYEDVPTRTEHHMFRDFFEERGYPAFVCDPRDLTYEGGTLRSEGRPIDIVYKRLLVNELLERIDELQAFLQAARDRRVTIVNPFRCKPIHKKAIFAVLTDDDAAKHFDADERAAIAAHVPWTRRAARKGGPRTTESRSTCCRSSRANRDRLVLKPNDEYGGKGVTIGWEASESEWDAALAEGLRASYVVQEKVELARQSFPELAEDGASASATWSWTWTRSCSRARSKGS